MRDLLSEAKMPLNGRPLILLCLILCEEERELERLRQRDELELGRGRERLSDVAAIEGSAEACVGRGLRGHERMFPCVSTLRKDRSLGLHALAQPYYGGRPWAEELIHFAPARASEPQPTFSRLLRPAIC